MIKKIKPCILFLMQLLFLQGIVGQAPSKMTDYLKEKFLRYVTTIPREEIYIHSDRDEYIAGEDLWFNIYLIDRQSFKPSTESKICYFELLNPENRPIVQKRIRLEGGSGPGQIVLPDTLSTGTYTIRGYTSWMKNFLPYNCFMKDIKIYNAFSARTIKRKLNSVSKLQEASLNRVNSGGMKTDLILKVDNLNRDVVEIVISADEKYLAGKSKACYLFIQTHGIIDYQGSEMIKGVNTKITISKEQLTSGINQITLFNSDGQPVDERFIYTPAKETPVIYLRTTDSSTLRTKISVNLDVQDLQASALKTADLSISVAAQTIEHSGMNLNDYLIFGTEFGLTPFEVIKDRKLNDIPPLVIDSLLQTVKSNWINWGSILKDEMPVLKYRVEKDFHYLSGRLISAGEKETDPDMFVVLSSPGKVALFQYARTEKGGNFSFKINISEDINDLIIQSDAIAKKQSVNIESSFSDRYLKSEFSVDSTIGKIPDYISTWGVNNQVMKIYGTSYVGETVSTNYSTPVYKRFYGKPETELIMKDYITLPNMQEVFFELLGGVALKSKKMGYEVIVNDPANNRPYDTSPGLFVDGVLVKDPAIIASIDPETVEKIDVIREKYFVGDFIFYGIINIITKAGDFSNASLSNDAVRLSYRVVDPVSSFISPDYSSEKNKRSRIPDFRNTLYWNPSVKPDTKGRASLEFWTSDLVSDYEINIQGITPEGKIISLRKIIKVTANK